MQPPVSVLMAVYNSANFLSEAIESILNQTLDNFEFLIIDDGSTDRSPEILQAYAAQDQRIRLIVQDNQGVPKARNKLLAIAQGEWIAIMDADDVALPDRFAHQVAFLQQHPDIVAVGSSFDRIDEKGRLLDHCDAPQTDRDIQTLLLGGTALLHHPCAMVRRSALVEIGGYNETMVGSCDLDLWLRLGEVGQLANLPETLTRYRLHGKSLTYRKQTRQTQDAQAACQRAWERRGIQGKFTRETIDFLGQQEFLRRCGWTGFNRGDRGMAIDYGLRAVRQQVSDWESWKLLICGLVKPMPRKVELGKRAGGSSGFGSSRNLGSSVSSGRPSASELPLSSGRPLNPPMLGDFEKKVSLPMLGSSETEPNETEHDRLSFPQHWGARGAVRDTEAADLSETAPPAAKPPIVSVLMAVHNTDRYLAQSVESILNQTFKDFELVAIDDGSRDRSLQILQTYAARDSRLRVISRENRGIPKTRNELLSLAQGEFVAVMDSDDIALPDRLANQVAYLQQHPDVLWLGGAFELMDAQGRRITRIGLPESDREIKTLLRQGQTSFLHPTAMLRRSVVVQVGGYDESLPLAEDLDLWLKLAEQGAVANLPQTVVQYRLHRGSICDRHQGLPPREIQIALERAWEKGLIAEKPQATIVCGWRPEPNPASRYAFLLKYGWWAFQYRQRDTARFYGTQAIVRKPWSSESWKLWICAIVKPLPQPQSP